MGNKVMTDDELRHLLIEKKAIVDFADENPLVAAYFDTLVWLKKRIEQSLLEKACGWIMDNFPTSNGISATMYADDFRKEMEKTAL